MSTNPYANPDLYDAIFLAGQQLPGVWKLSFPTVDEGWKAQEPKGSDGGEVTRDGRKLAAFDAEGRLWYDIVTKRDHFSEWDQLWPALLATTISKNASKALDIYHRQLVPMNIGSVVIAKWTAPQPNGAHSIVKLSFLQFAPPKKKTASGKPNGSKGGGGVLGLLNSAGGLLLAGVGAGGGGTATSGGAAPPKGPDPDQDLLDGISAGATEYNNV